MLGGAALRAAFESVSAGGYPRIVFVLQARVAVLPLPEFRSIYPPARSALSVLARDRRDKRDVHMRRFLVHVDDCRHHELLPADLVNDKAVGIAEEIPRSFLAQPVEELFVRRNNELAKNGALLFAREPQVSFEPVLIAYSVELLLVTRGGWLFQMIIQAGARGVDVIV